MLRRFLLVPGPDGKEPQPINGMNAMLTSILTVPPRDRQHLVLVVCEMIALVSGLLLQVPLTLTRHHSSWRSSEIELGAERPQPMAKGWDVLPSLEDGMDALAYINFNCLLYCAVYSVSMALIVAAGGWHAGDSFTSATLPLLGLLLGLLQVGGLIPLMILLTWELFTAASSPYPTLAGVVLAHVLISNGCWHMWWTFLLEVMPLEVYHCPRWYIKLSAGQLPLLKARLDRKALKPHAERRAAELRKRCGMGFSL